MNKNAMPLKIDPHTQFFGNMVDASLEFDLLTEYVLNMTKTIQAAQAKCRSEAVNRRPSLQAIAEDDSDLFAEQFPRLLHVGTIISTIIFLEQVLNDFAGNLQKIEKLNLALRDLNGPLIERFRKYCVHIAKLPFSISDQDWESLRGVLEIRNCLTHSDGMLAEFQKASTIRAFIRHHNTPRIEEERLVVDEQTSLKVLKIVKAFTDGIHEAALRKYPNQRRGRR